jgi:hypothetical protein
VALTTRIEPQFPTRLLVVNAGEKVIRFSRSRPRHVVQSIVRGVSAFGMGVLRRMI